MNEDEMLVPIQMPGGNWYVLDGNKHIYIGKYQKHVYVSDGIAAVDWSAAVNSDRTYPITQQKPTAREGVDDININDKRSRITVGATFEAPTPPEAKQIPRCPDHGVKMVYNNAEDRCECTEEGCRKTFARKHTVGSLIGTPPGKDQRVYRGEIELVYDAAGTPMLHLIGVNTLIDIAKLIDTVPSVTDITGKELSADPKVGKGELQRLVAKYQPYKPPTPYKTKKFRHPSWFDGVGDSKYRVASFEQVQELMEDFTLPPHVDRILLTHIFFERLESSEDDESIRDVIQASIDEYDGPAEYQGSGRWIAHVRGRDKDGTVVATHTYEYSDSLSRESVDKLSSRINAVKQILATAGVEYAMDAGRLYGRG